MTVSGFPQSTMIVSTKAAQLASQAGRGNLSATSTLLRAFDATIRSAGAQVKIGSLSTSGASTNITLGSNWTPAAVLLARQLGTAVYLGMDIIGDGKATFIRCQTLGGPASMGNIASLGIYLQSNGFGLGSTLAVASKSYGYIALRTGPNTTTSQ